MSVFTIRGIYICSLNDEIYEKILFITKSKKFLEFIDLLNSKDNLKNIILRINNASWYYEPNPENLGFLYMELFALDKQNNNPVSDIIILRCENIAIYLRVIFNNKKYVVLTKQLNVPVGTDTLEIIPGIMDENKNILIMKEININELTENKLISLGDYFPNSNYCVECIKLFYFEININEEQFNKFQGNTYSNDNKIILIPDDEYEDILKNIKDEKTIFAHNFAKDKKLLNT